MDGVCSRDERERRCDDFARDAQRLHANLQSHHAVGEQRDVLHAKVFRQSGLKLAVELAVVGEPLVVPNLLKIGG